ncbi:hypothetical protein LCGC14_3083430 [marine sediment metagenome]|uniref:Uncharacterized protein n=1 Tax=marine sediment metagenome TaxID=412755 RepID=A0A0F8YK78_9ZZZZ
MTTLRDIIDGARDELREWCKFETDRGPPDEAIHEIADGVVPIYTNVYEAVETALYEEWETIKEERGK